MKATEEEKQRMKEWYVKNREKHLKDVRNNRLKNHGKYLERMREYSSRLEIRDKAKEHYEKNKAKLVELNKEWRKSTPEIIKKEKIRGWTAYQGRIGNITKDNCAICDSIENLEFHHEEYIRDLDFVWVLCKDCNQALERVDCPKQFEVINTCA